MPNNNPQFKNESSLMNAMIEKLSEYSGHFNQLIFPLPKKKKVAALIKLYKTKEISTYQQLIGHLSLIDCTADTPLSMIKKEIAEMVVEFRQRDDSNRTSLPSSAASSSSSAASSSSSAASSSYDTAEVDTTFLFNPDKKAVILQLGQMLLEGNDLYIKNFMYFAKAHPEDTKVAFSTLSEQCYKATKQANSASAWTLLGLLHQIEIGIKQEDYQSIYKFYRIAIKHGDSFAMYNMAQMYKHGDGVKKDIKMAVKFYEMAVVLGNTNAMNKLANCYQHGVGVTKDCSKAILLYMEAIKRGNPHAMNDLAYYYYSIEKNYSEAMLLYKRALAHGNADAHNGLACIYFEGLGVEKDYQKAILLFRKAIMLGSLSALSNLAVMYELGQGVEKNLNVAEALLQVAVKQGFKSAKNDLKKVQQLIKSTSTGLSSQALDGGETALINQLVRNIFEVNCDAIEGSKGAVIVKFSLPEAQDVPVNKIFPSKTKIIFSPAKNSQRKITIKNLSVDDFRTLCQSMDQATGMNDASLAASSSGSSSTEFEPSEMEKADTTIAVALSSQGLFRPEDEHEDEHEDVQDETKPYTHG